jgi:hypothetical protein
MNKYNKITFTPIQDNAAQRCDMIGIGGLARERYHQISHSYRDGHITFAFYNGIEIIV